MSILPLYTIRVNLSGSQFSVLENPESVSVPPTERKGFKTPFRPESAQGKTWVIFYLKVNTGYPTHGYIQN